MERWSGARTGTVIEPLLTIERDDLTGTLEFEARDVRTTIHAVAGEVVFAEGGTVGETLGRQLLRSRRIGDDHFAGVIRRMLDLIADDKVVRFGEVLLEYGFLDPDELDLALMHQVRDKVAGCIHRGDGRWKFEPMDAADVEVSHHVVRLRPALIEAAAHLPERRIEEILRLSEHRYPEIVAPERVIAAEFELTAEEAEVLLDLNGTSSLHFILPKASSPKIASLIAALVLGGGVELRTRPAAGMRGEDRPVPPTFVTLRRAASASQVSTTMATMPDLEPTGRYEKANTIPDLREADGSYSTVSARRAPDRRPTREPFGPNTEKVEERTRHAYERLHAELEKRKPTNDRRRWPEPMDDRERRLLAESAFQQGRLLLRGEEAERALPGLARAHELRPDAREYELYVKWAQMIVNDSFRDERRRADMEELAAATLHQDPRCELAFSILGHCAFHGGNEAAALRFFQRAAHLDPKRVDASRLSDLAASHAGQRPRTFSHPDARSRARGELRAMLDEVVPQPVVAETAQAARRPLPKTTPTLRPAPPEPGDADAGVSPERRTPMGGLAVASALPPPSQTQTGPLPPPVLPPRSISKPPPPREAQRSPSPSPASTRPRPPPAPSHPPHRAPSPKPPPSGPTGPRLVLPSPEDRPPASVPPPASAERPSRPPARPPPLPSPWRIPTTPTATGPHPIVAAPASQRPAAAAPPPALPPAPAVVVDSERPSDAHAIARARRPRLVALAVAVWIGALGAAAVLFHLYGSSGAPSEDKQPAATATASAKGRATASAPSPTVAASPASALPPGPPATESAPPAPTVAAAPSASGKPSGTGILRVPRAVGRRIYVDGHIYGEGGRDLIVPCGTRKVRIGSAGTDRVREIPCDSVLEL